MDPQWRALAPRPVRRLPADLAATIALTGLTLAAVALPVVRETPLRIVLGLPFVLFLPGYAFVAALFPEAGEGPVAGDEGAGAERDGDAAPGGLDVIPTDRGIDGIERAALSFGLSIAIVPLIGLALNFTPWGIRLGPILISVSAFTVGCSVVAAWRRWELPAEERFRVPYGEWYAAGRAELLEPADRTDAALNVLLVASVLLALGSVGYAIAVPPDGERYTEFYLLTEREDGDLVAADYPEELVVGEPAAVDVVVGIGNREHETVEYTVVVQLQRVAFLEDGTVVEDDPGGNATNVTDVRVLERREVGRFETTLEHDESWHLPHEVVAPGMVGEDRRLQYLLYREEVPAEPTRSNAYRDAHLWVDVVEPDGG